MPAFGQVDPQRFFQQFVRPGGIIDNMARPQSDARLSDRPSISCNRALSAVGQILCFDKAGAAADWDLNATLWAIDGSLDDSQKKAFETEQQGWRASLDASCRPPRGAGSFSGEQRVCVIKAFHDRAGVLRTRLSGDALDESRLSPEEHARIQQALVSRNFLVDAPDGEFGSNTRQAIRSFQNNEKAKATGILSREQRNTLLAGMQPPPAAGAAAPGIASDGRQPAPPNSNAPDAANSAMPDQSNPPFLLRIYGPRQPVFAIGRAADADAICTQLRHPLFSHNQPDYYAGNSPIALDPQNLGSKWITDRVLGPTQGRLFTVELDETTRAATDDALKACLRTIAATDGNRIGNIRRLLPGLSERCADAAGPRTESFLGPSGQMLQRPAPEQPQQQRCATWGLMQSSSVTGPNAYLMLLTLAEAHPALKTLMDNAEATVQAGITARQQERARIEEQNRAAEEARRKAEDERRQAEAAAQQARARQLAEQQQQAEQKLQQQRAIAQTKGPEYAGKGDTSWSLSSKNDEMTDKIALEAFSQQKTPNGVVAEVRVKCFDGKFSVIALIVDTDGKPTISLPSVEIMGTPVVRAQVRLNEDEPQDVVLGPVGNFRNELDVSRSLNVPITNGAYWRLYVSIPTEIEPIIVKVPLFEPQVQKAVKSCS